MDEIKELVNDDETKELVNDNEIKELVNDDETKELVNDEIKELVNNNLKSVEVCFFHIEKCMGSSLRIILYNYFKNIYDESQIFEPGRFNNHKFNLNSKNDVDNLNNYFLKVILAHCNYNDKYTNIFSKNCFSITCIRNPIDRLLSHYYYFDFVNEKKALHELSNEKINYYINQYGCTILIRLSGLTMDLNTTYDNIKKINCILVFENIKTELDLMNNLFNKKFNKNINIEIINENETKFNYKIFRKEDIKIINEKLDLIPDIKIYEFVINMDIKDRFKI
jgi:hypothetical protein